MRTPWNTIFDKCVLTDTSEPWNCFLCPVLIICIFEVFNYILHFFNISHRTYGRNVKISKIYFGGLTRNEIYVYEKYVKIQMTQFFCRQHFTDFTYGHQWKNPTVRSNSSLVESWKHSCTDWLVFGIIFEYNVQLK